LSFLQEVGNRFWIFGPSGRPEAVPHVDLDGVNIIAAYREYAGILPRISL
jgi:hypothetical protein